jgi:hypothetical protein
MFQPFHKTFTFQWKNRVLLSPFWEAKRLGLRIRVRIEDEVKG